MNPAPSMREAASDDAPFLRALFEAVRPGLLALPEALVEMQFRAQEGSYRARFPGLRTLILLDADRPVGKLALHDLPDAVRIVDVAVLPSEQGRGLGSRVVEAVLAEAGAREVLLSVENDNPAQRLYARLGFEPCGASQDGLRVEMRWKRW